MNLEFVDISTYQPDRFRGIESCCSIHNANAIFHFFLSLISFSYLCTLKFKVFFIAQCTCACSFTQNKKLLLLFRRFFPYQNRFRHVTFVISFVCSFEQKRNKITWRKFICRDDLKKKLNLKPTKKF